MTRHAAIIVSVVVALSTVRVVSGADVPTTKPLPSPVEREWLDHARTALGEWVLADDPDLIPMPVDVATALVLARGDDEDRAVLRKAMTLPLRQLKPKDKMPLKLTDEQYARMVEQNRVVGVLIKAKPLIALGETDEARRVIADGRKQLEALGEAPGFWLDIARATLADLYSRLNTAADDEEAIRLDQTGLLAHLAERHGRVDLTRRLLDKQADNAISSLSQKQGEKAWINIERLVSELTRHGKEQVARKLLDRHTGYQKANALVSMASAFYQQGRDTAGDEALREALQVPRGAAGVPVAQLAQRYGRGELVREAVRRSLKESSDVYSLARLASYAGWLNDAALFDACIAAAIKAQQKEASADEPEQLSRVAETHRMIASAYAGAGKHQQMNEALAAADAIHREKDYSVSEGFGSVLIALIWRGEDKVAEELAARYFTDAEDADWMRSGSAVAHLARQEYGEAFSQAAKVGRFYNKRQLIQSHALHRLIIRGDGATATKLWMSIPSPSDRAIVALTVADLLNGQRAIGEQIIGRAVLD